MADVSEKRAGDGPWPESVEGILDGDLCVAMGYLTPAGGVVVLPVTTLGLHDPEQGTVTTSSSFGLWKKFTRIQARPQVAMAYHARENGLASGAEIVLVQGPATFPDCPDADAMAAQVLERVGQRLITPKTGRFWDWVGREYYMERVPITVTAERATVWPDADTAEPASVNGEPWPGEAPEPHSPPRGGTATRVKLSKVAKRLGRARHTLLGYQDADGRVVLRTVRAEPESDHLRVEAAGLPPGGRRAGLLAHWFEPRLDGQGAAVLTGWFEADGEGGRYFAHTDAGYAMPTNAFLFSLGGGLAAKAGYRKAVKAGLVRDGCWQRDVPAGG